MFGPEVMKEYPSTMRLNLQVDSQHVSSTSYYLKGVHQLGFVDVG